MPGYTRPRDAVQVSMSTERCRCPVSRARVGGMATTTPLPSPESDALLGQLFPMWHLVIGAFVLVVLVLSIRRLAARGPSRMTTALLVTGGAIAGLTALSIYFDAS